VTVANDPGLEFMLTNFSTGAGTQSSPITFTITAPASAPMTDASNAVTGSATGGGAFGASEVLSNGITLAASNLNPTVSATFPAAVTTLTVTDTLSVSEAQLFTATSQFSETPVSTPEPSSIALLGVALSAFGMRRRRKSS
jgi:hypothetical protein